MVKCNQTDCKIKSSFNFEEETKSLYCKSNKKDGMINITNKHINNINDLVDIVSKMKLKDNQNKKQIYQKINSNPTLTGKCIIAREYLKPQSTDMEKICRTDLGIGKPLDKISGDGCKNCKNYEIKISIHSSKSKLNFVQIRPDHKVDYYILIAYNMYENKTIGKGYIFKIPSEELYKLVLKYGGYAHGTIKKLGEITINNMKKRNCEYALRCNPNVKIGKNFELWSELLKYEVDYHPKNF